MAIMVTKEDELNKELSQRIDADLREKMNSTTKNMDNGTDPDFTEDSEYVRDYKKTGKFAWLWVVVGIAIVVTLIIVGLNH